MFKIGLILGICLILFPSSSVLAGIDHSMVVTRIEDQADTERTSIHHLQADAGSVQAMVPCTEPRPQVCTQDYRPVCAELQNGSFKTFSNGCSACSDPDVIGYREGACQ